MVVIFVVVIMVLIVVFVMIMVLVVMLVLVFAMELALTLIMPVNPFMMVFRPMSGYPHPIVTILPVERTIVIRPATQLDRAPDRHCAWPHHQANRQESHYKSCKFRFHSRYRLFVLASSPGRINLQSLSAFIPCRTIRSINCGYFRPA